MSIVKVATFSGIKINPEHKGLLHEALNIPGNEPIPTETLEKALQSTTDPIMRKRINFALNARKWKHR